MTTPSRTFRTLRTMTSGGVVKKLAGRLRHPSMAVADVRRLKSEFQRDAVRWYASYHEKRQTPGRVYRIWGRHCRMWLPMSFGETVAQRRFGLFEPMTFDTLQRIVKPGFAVVEIGACYGEFTIHLSRLVGPEGLVFSFEPFPKYFAIAEKNVALNELANVRLMNQAIGPAEVRSLELDPEANHPYGSLSQISGLDYGARTFAGGAPSGAHASVPCVPLSQFLRAEQVVPDLVFMDIEGCEIQVFPDLEPLLRSPGKRPIVYFELHSHFYKDGDQAGFEALFRECGYSMERIAGLLLCLPPPAGARA